MITFTIILIILAIILNRYNKERNIKTINEENKDQTNNKYIFNNYKTKNYIMTNTENNFYNELEKQFKIYNIECNIFPQVDLERIIQTKNNNNADRNRIKSRSIDFVITNKFTNKICLCIELDDYTHYRSDRIERDCFINELFKSVDIKLIRVNVSNNYNFETIIDYLKNRLIEPLKG